ncbi:MAG: hypothetical protein Q4Q53_00500 [Methanocorpusculum sp.]|nr:hypothetical protein [Methanocorpusculum sp.]
MKIIAPVCVIAVVLLIISAGCIAEEKTVTKESVMKEATAEISDRLNDAVGHITASANEIAMGKDAKSALAGLYQKTTLAQSILCTDENGTVIAGYPDFMKESIGKDLSSYGIDVNTFNDKAYDLSKYLPLEDKTRACVLSVPITDNGKFNGYISVAFDTYRLLGSINDNLNEKYGYNMWVIETDGTQIYDPDLSEVGTNVLTDSAYSDENIHNTMIEISENIKGTAQYKYRGDKTDDIVTKEAYWDTFSYGGQNWRVVITSVQ